jgi:hypothetical protein
MRRAWHIGQHSINYKLPSYIELVEDFPKTQGEDSETYPKIIKRR